MTKLFLISVTKKLDHLKQDTRNPQPRIDPLPYLHHRPQKILHPHHSQKLGIHRNNHLVRSGQGINRQSPQRRTSINQNIIIPPPQRLQNPGQHPLRPHLQPQLRIHHRQINRRWDEIHPVLRPYVPLRGRHLLILNPCHHQIPNGILQNPRILHAEACCQIRLTVKIHSQNPLPHLPQTIRQIERSSSLRRTPFLRTNHIYLSHPQYLTFLSATILNCCSSNTSI